MRVYPEWLILYRMESMEDSPSWVIGGINQKWWNEGYERGRHGLLSNPRSEAAKMGYAAGCKARKLINLLEGKL